MKVLPSYVYMCGFVSKREWSGHESCVCVFAFVCVRMHMDVLLSVGQNALPLWNAVHTTDDMKWPPRSSGLTSHQCCYL